MSFTPRFVKRAKHHVVLLVLVMALLFLLIKLIPGTDPKYLWSMGTGYVSIILLALTLLVGPLNIYTRRLNPVSGDFRRDVGIWCGITGLVHVAIGSQVHMGNILLYFFKAVQGEDSYKFRDDIFGYANYSGLMAGAVMLVLLVLSNDLTLQWLRPTRWKGIQRWNYFLFLLVLAHGVLYQIIEKRILTLIIVFSTIMLMPLIGQAIGFSIARKK